VRIGGDEPGKRVISVGQIQLNLTNNTPNATDKTTLIDTQQISFNEKGYLIVGVSGLETGWGGPASTRTASAVIKPPLKRNRKRTIDRAGYN
jgi:hypothetical protein